MIDRETIFFFMGLFIVIGGLEHMEVIAMVWTTLVSRAWGSMATLLFYVTMWSGVLSTFIDNVPYNITMVSAIKAMAASGISVYPLRWALNLGTSFGGAWSPIGAACSVVSLGEAEKEHIHFGFLDYMTYAFPLVIINGLITFGLLYLKFL
jgi:Na+/H+ antiporter NhaD/arsenite permease-like protein